MFIYIIDLKSKKGKTRQFLFKGNGPSLSKAYVQSRIDELYGKGKFTVLSVSCWLESGLETL